MWKKQTMYFSMKTERNPYLQSHMKNLTILNVGILCNVILHSEKWEINYLFLTGLKVSWCLEGFPDYLFKNDNNKPALKGDLSLTFKIT